MATGRISIILLVVVVLFFGFTNYSYGVITDYVAYWQFENDNTDYSANSYDMFGASGPGYFTDGFVPQYTFRDHFINLFSFLSF